MSKTTANEFWDWFSKNVLDKKLEDIPSYIVDAVDSMIFAHGFDWEIGPGINKKFMFCLSLRGKRDKLSEAKSFISEAPKSNDWEYFSTKQKKNWKLRSFIRTKDGEKEIDFSKWEYVIYHYKDGSYEIDLKPFFTDGIDFDSYYDLAILLLNSELGEKKTLFRIERVNIVDEWEDKEIVNKKNVISGELDRFIT